MLIGIVLIIAVYSSGDFCYLLDVTFDPFWQKFIWISFFVSFIVKLPSIPLHIWLPEAHVEAPTGGSIILAGILLKLGGYGFYRFLIPLFPDATIYFSPLVLFLGVSSILYASLVAIRQVDIKKIIAYSSIAHMGFVMIAFASLNEIALQGGFFIMISHGIVSSALFACIGVLYDRYKTKLIIYYKSLLTVMPLFTCLFFCATLANISLPLTSGFIGEFFVLFGIFQFNFIATFIACFSVILSVVYSLWLFNRVFFGSLSTKYIKFYQDLDVNETICLSTLCIIILVFGLFPWILIEQFEFSIRFTNWIALLKLL
jgi:NADH-quinone oxidoreductase subunit M